MLLKIYAEDYNKFRISKSEILNNIESPKFKTLTTSDFRAFVTEQIDL